MSIRSTAGKAPVEHNRQAPIREDSQEQIEVHVAGVCVRPRLKDGVWEVLIAKRTRERSLYPGRWECGGGQVRSGETLEDAVKRQIFEEFGIEIEPCHVLETYAIHVPSERRVIPGVRFLCLAGNARVRLNKREFSCHRWSTFPVPNYDWIEGVKNMLDVIGPELSSRIPGRKPPEPVTQRELPLVSSAVH
jgi:8-oxo-dGTP pyrophosphatase MutT (NUDIX family)